jgi:hypothetical protein
MATTSTRCTVAPFSAYTRTRFAEVAAGVGERGASPSASPVPWLTTTMVAVAPARTMTPLSRTSSASASQERTMGSSRTVPRGTST